MNQDEQPPPPPRRRFWWKLLLWSAVGTGMIFSIVSQDVVGIGGTPLSRRELVIQALRLVVIASAVLVHFFIFTRIWPRRPRTERGWFILGATSLVLGVLTVCWFAGNGLFRTERFLGRPLVMFSVIMTAFYFWLLLVLRSTREFCRWFFRWRIFILFALAALLPVGAFVGFRAEENWRGQRAWEMCRTELKAQGEIFLLASYAPPRVPDEQNFALAPVIATTYANNGGYESARQPTDGISRLDMNLERQNSIRMPTRRIGDWRLASVTDLRPWQTYYRMRFTNNAAEMPPPFRNPYAPPTVTGVFSNAVETNASTVTIETETNEFPNAGQPQSPALDVLLALSRFDETIEEIRTAGSRPCSRFPLKYEEVSNPNYPDESRSVHTYALFRCCTVLQLRAIAELQAGQTDKAYADVNLMLRLADAIRDEPMLPPQFTRNAIIGLAIQPVWEGLAGHAWTLAQLNSLQEKLARTDLLAGWALGMRGERIHMLDFLEFEKTNRTDFAAMMLLGRLSLDEKDWANFFHLPQPLQDFVGESLEPIGNSRTFEWSMERINHAAPDGWFDLEKVKTATAIQAYLTTILKPPQHLIDRARILQMAAAANTPGGSSNPRYYYYYGYLDYSFTGPIFADAPRTAKGQNAADMAMLACALERFHLAQQNYPATLDALVPQYLEKIPPDVVNGQPLHYERKGRGAFKLYSVGWNGKDDGGSINLKYSGRRESDTDDWVWEYPVKP